MTSGYIVDHSPRSPGSPPAPARVLIAVAATQRRPLLYGYGPTPRAIRGQLLCDEHGRFYEKVGDRVWPVHRFVPDPRGEALVHAAATGPMINEASRAGEEPPAAPEPQPRDAPAHRTMWPEPGERRIIVWGQWRALIAHQIRHPSRLRDGHRLPAVVQVYEITRSVDLEAWRETLPSAAADLLPLTDDLIARLRLPVAPSRRPLSTLTSGTQLAPGDRLARVQLVSDPTASSQTRANSSQPDAQQPGGPSRDTRRNSIPDPLVRAWEFVRSREDAAYECVRSSRRGWIARLGTRVQRLVRRADWRRWRTLLAGKEPDEQLWSVRPPKGSLTDPMMREWARAALQAARYDADVMLTEWEIFWRRKSL